MARKAVTLTKKINIQSQPSSIGKGQKRKAGKDGVDDSTPAGSAGTNGPTARNYSSWAEDETRLLDWLEDPDNYALYKGTGHVNSQTGKINTSGKTKQIIYGANAAYLQHLGSTRTNSVVQKKNLRP